MLAVEWSQGIEDAWSEVATFVPKLLAAIAVFLIGWLVAKFLRRVIERILNRIDFDKYVDKSGIGQPLANAGYDNSVDLIGKIIYFGLMLLVLQLTVGVFGDTEVSRALSNVVGYIPRIIVAAIIIVITGVIANGVRQLIAPAVAHLSAGDFLTKLAFVAIWVVGAFAAIDQLDIASDVVDVLWQTIAYSLGLIFVIKFGVGGIWAARDRFWPAVYDQVTGAKGENDAKATTAPAPPAPGATPPASATPPPPPAPPQS